MPKDGVYAVSERLKFHTTVVNTHHVRLHSSMEHRGPVILAQLAQRHTRLSGGDRKTQERILSL